MTNPIPCPQPLYQGYPPIPPKTPDFGPPPILAKIQEFCPDWESY